MGHIVNTISTRIGWFDSWKDEFFLEFSYHCDYVHHFLRIRAMLVYLFFKKTPWDEFIIIFSHFDLFKIRRTIYLIVYAYFGKIILFGIGYEKYFDIFSKRLSRRKYNKTIRFSNHFILRMLLVKGLCVFLNKFFLMLDKRERKKRRNEIKNEHRLLNDVTPDRKEIVLYHEFASRKQCFENSDWVEKRSWICKKFRYPWDTNFNYYRKHVHNFRLFRSLLDFPPTKDGLLRPRLKYMRKLSSRIYLLYSMTKWASYCQFSETLFFINVYKKYLGWICDYLRYLISVIYISDKAVVSIERLTNEDVGSVFVTRYMLRKLEQNFTWKQVITPILRELRYLMILGHGDNISCSLEEKKSYQFGKLLYNMVFHLAQHYYNYLLWTNTKRVNMLCEAEILNLIFSARIYKNIKIGRVFYLLVNIILLNLLVHGWEIIMHQVKIDNNLINNFYSSNIHYLLLDKLYGICPSTNYDMFNAGFDHNKYLNLQLLNCKYFRFYFKDRIIPFEYDNQISRYRSNYNNEVMEGFKLRLGGRLTRKQRASSYWIMYGSVPLNTFSSFIDYAFYTLPLRNSEVTIRLWFNKSLCNQVNHMVKQENILYETISRMS